MTVFSWLWIGWVLAGLTLEGVALVVKDRPPKELRTLTANTRWVIGSAGTWHTVARIVLGLFLAWLPGHFGVSM